MTARRSAHAAFCSVDTQSRHRHFRAMRPLSLFTITIVLLSVTPAAFSDEAIKGSIVLGPSDPAHLLHEGSAKSALKAAELAMAALEAHTATINHKQSKLDAEIKTHNEQVEAAKKVREQFDADLQQHRANIASHHAQLNKFNEQVKAYNAEVQQSTGRNPLTVDRLNAQKRILDSWAARINLEKTALDSTNAALDSRAANIDASAAELDHQARQLNQRLAALNAQRRGAYEPSTTAQTLSARLSSLLAGVEVTHQQRSPVTKRLLPVWAHARERHTSRLLGLMLLWIPIGVSVAFVVYLLRCYLQERRRVRRLQRRLRTNGNETSFMMPSRGGTAGSGHEAVSSSVPSLNSL